MKKFTIIAAALFAAASCQEVLIEDKADGAISVRLENSPVVEVVTKADDSVDENEFNVYITSEDALDFEPISKKYRELDAVMAVGVGNYTIYADNVTEGASLAGRGQVRYACDPVTKPVEAGKAATFELKCSMVNTAVSVEFIGNFANYVTEYGVKVWTEDNESRKLEYNADNAAVGYFKPSESYYLVYEFTGEDKEGNPIPEISDRMKIQPKTHLTLQFRIKGDESGNLNKPTIEVDTDCEELSVEVEVDPTQDTGSGQ